MPPAMLIYSDEKQPLYGLIGILVVLFAAIIAVWVYLAS
jgi:hypothetical protein